MLLVNILICVLDVGKDIKMKEKQGSKKTFSRSKT